MVNSPRIVGYSCLEGIKCEIRDTDNAAKGKKEFLLCNEIYVLKFDKISSRVFRLLKDNLPLLSGKNSTPLFDQTNKLLYITREQLEYFTSCHDEEQLNRSVGDTILDTIDNFKREFFDVPYSRGILHLGKKTHVMGILNVTPDSFYDGKRYTSAENAMDYGLKMAEDGADIIDIGGESTRPGASPVPEKEEIKRVIPVIKALSKQIRQPISIDTYKARVAEDAVCAGASVINDIGGLLMDKNMAKVVAKMGVPVILMHKKGTPKTMQKYPIRKNVVSEIIVSLRKSVSIALDAGIEKDKIILDPGIGFGKTGQHNLEILKRLREFKSMGFPLLIGTSRKRFIGNILDIPIGESLYGTLATIAVAAMNGAHIVRVHDVREVVQMVTMCDAVRNI